MSKGVNKDIYFSLKLTNLFYSFAICLVSCIRSELGVMKYFLHGLCRHRNKKQTKGIGMGIMNSYIQVQGWRPKLPTMFYKELKALISDCWEHDPDDRPDFDEIVRRLNGEVREEVWMKPEPSFVCDENFLKNSVDYEESEEEEVEEEKLIMLKQSYMDLLTKLEQETPSNDNAEFIAMMKERISRVEGELEAKQQQRKNASELAGTPVRGRGRRKVAAKKKEKTANVGEEPAVPLPAMFAGIVGNIASDTTRGDR